MEHPGDNVVPFRLRSVSGTGLPTFHDLAQDWLRTEATRMVRPEDVRRHVNHLRALWRLTERELRPAAIKEAAYALLAPAGALSAATVNKVLGTGKRIIREAQVNERWGGTNPFDMIRRLKQVRPVTRPLSLNEVRAALPHLRADRRREVLVMLYLGLRPGELKALQRVDVDASARTITVHRSNGRDQTKTGKPRHIPIPEGLWPALEAAMDAAPEGGRLIFPNSTGGLQREDAKLSRVLKAALSKAGLITGYRYACRRKGCGYRGEGRTPEPGGCPTCGFKLWASPVPIPVRFYDLRHSAATLHREAGADPLAIQLVLGHAPDNLTDGVYTHLSMEYVRREMNRLKI